MKHMLMVTVHDTMNSGELAWLLKVNNVPEDVADKFAQTHRPLEGIKAIIHYDDVADESTVRQIFVDGNRFVPALED